MTVLRPRRGVALGIIAAAALGSLSYVVDGLVRGTHPGVALVPVAVAITGAALGAILLVSNARLEFGRDVIRTRSMLGRARELPTTSLSRILVVPAVRQAFGADLAFLVILDAAGRRFAFLNLARWDAAQVIAATAQYRERVEVIDERVSRRELEARHPGALPFGVKHTNLTVLLFGLCAFVVIFGIAAAFEFSS